MLTVTSQPSFCHIDWKFSHIDIVVQMSLGPKNKYAIPLELFHKHDIVKSEIIKKIVATFILEVIGQLSKKQQISHLRKTDKSCHISQKPKK